MARNFNNCAAGVADKYSAASLLHVNNVPVLGFALGSSSAAASRVVFGTHPSEYVPAGANLVAGVKAGAILTGAATTAGKIPVDQGFQSIFTTIAPTQLGETTAGSLAISGAKSLAGFLHDALPWQILGDEIAYGYGEAACTAQSLGGW